MKYVSTLFITLMLSSFAFSNESAEVERLAEKYKAETEVRLWDNTRADMLNNTHVYEVDWVHKYAEGVGQALYYAEVTNRHPNLILLVKNRVKEQRFMYRARITAKAANVKLHFEYIRPVSGQVVFGQDEKPIRIYYIYDPENDEWYRKNALGFSAWGTRGQAAVWSIRQNAQRALSGLFGARGSRCEIKAYVTIPAKDNQ